MCDVNDMTRRELLISRLRFNCVIVRWKCLIRTVFGIRNWFVERCEVERGKCYLSFCYCDFFWKESSAQWTNVLKHIQKEVINVLCERGQQLKTIWACWIQKSLNFLLLEDVYKKKIIFWAVLVNNSAQVMSIFKAKTFICKNMCNISYKILTRYF